MNTKHKIWFGVGVFAVMQVAGMSMEGGRPTLSLIPTAQAADGVCGWERNDGRWTYDRNCSRGERYVSNPKSHFDRGERGDRHDNGRHRGWERGEQGDRGHGNERGSRGEGGNDRWGERGERG